MPAKGLRLLIQFYIAHVEFETFAELPSLLFIKPGNNDRKTYMGPRDIKSLVDYIRINFETGKESEPSNMVNSVLCPIYKQ